MFKGIQGESKINRVSTINEIDNENLLNIMFSKDIIVFEDVQGSKIWVNWNGEEFKIRPKSVSNDDINLVDLAMQNYYNPAIEFFNRFGSIRNPESSPVCW